MVFKKIKNIMMDNFRKKIIDIKVIRKYFNEEKYISAYNYMTYQHDQYRLNNRYYKNRKIYINDFDVIKKNIEIRKMRLDNLSRKLGIIESDNDKKDIVSKKHHQLHMIYCFLVQNFEDKKKKKINNFLHNYVSDS